MYTFIQRYNLYAQHILHNARNCWIGFDKLHKILRNYKLFFFLNFDTINKLNLPRKLGIYYPFTYFRNFLKTIEKT